MQPSSIYSSDYKSWKIAVLSHIDAHTFNALPPEGGEPLSDGCIYTSVNSALMEAQSFVDKRIARNEVGAICDDLVEQGQLDPKTHASLLTALAENARSRLLD